MSTYQFAIIASGLDPTAEDFEDRFFEAGCGDATLSFQKGKIILEFTREARSLAHALISAIRNVRAAGARVEHIEPDSLVSLTDISDRTGLSKAAISLFSKGARGSKFPSPIARLTTKNPLWDWVQVARWMFARRHVGRRTVVDARVMEELSAVLGYTAHAEHVARYTSPASPAAMSRGLSALLEETSKRDETKKKTYKTGT